MWLLKKINYDLRENKKNKNIQLKKLPLFASAVQTKKDKKIVLS